MDQNLKLLQRLADCGGMETEFLELKRDAERYRKLCEVPGALDAFTAAYYNTQTKAQIDAAIDDLPAVGAA